MWDKVTRLQQGEKPHAQIHSVRHVFPLSVCVWRKEWKRWYSQCVTSHKNGEGEGTRAVIKTTDIAGQIAVQRGDIFTFNRILIWEPNITFVLKLLWTFLSAVYIGGCLLRQKWTPYDLVHLDHTVIGSNHKSLRKQASDQNIYINTYLYNAAVLLTFICCHKLL